LLYADVVHAPGEYSIVNCVILITSTTSLVPWGWWSVLIKWNFLFKTTSSANNADKLVRRG